MRSTLIASLITCIVFISSVWGATIVSPQENEQVDAGSWITVKVKPDPGEQWQGFALGFKALEYDEANEVYKISIQVPNDVLGYRDDLRVIGVDLSGREVELTRKVYVKMPPDVVLESIMVSKSTMVLFKFPSDSEPENVTRIESRQLHVGGVYSDGVKRSLTSSATGTTYQSSNQDVVTVSPEGLVTAINTGKARITIKNGSFRKEVDVVVKPYK